MTVRRPLRVWRWTVSAPTPIVAARQILQLLEGDDREVGHVAEHVELPTELVLRTSTAPPREA